MMIWWLTVDLSGSLTYCLFIDPLLVQMITDFWLCDTITLCRQVEVSPVCFRAGSGFILKLSDYWDDDDQIRLLCEGFDFMLESQRATDAHFSLETESNNNQLQHWTLLSGLQRQLRTWMQELEGLGGCSAAWNEALTFAEFTRRPK